MATTMMTENKLRRIRFNKYFVILHLSSHQCFVRRFAPPGKQIHKALPSTNSRKGHYAKGAEGSALCMQSQCSVKTEEKLPEYSDLKGNFPLFSGNLPRIVILSRHGNTAPPRSEKHVKKQVHKNRQIGGWTCVHPPSTLESQINLRLGN